MKKVFISQPMSELRKEEILKTREEIKSKIESKLGETVEILPSFFDNYNPVGNAPVAFLGKSITLLAEADIAYFGGNWKNARGCIIEHEVATKYGIPIIEEK